MDVLPRRILLASDGSEDAALARRAAVDLSNRSGAELHVVHVAHTLPRYEAHVEHAVGKLLAGEDRRTIERRVEKDGGVLAGAHLRVGRPVGEILAVAEEIDAGLIVAGSRGLGLFKRVILGSVSEGLIHHSDRPVLVVRGGAWPPNGVVVSDDGSGEAGEAARLGTSVAGLLGAGTTLVRTRPRLPVPPEGGRDLTEQAVGEAELQIEAGLLERADELEAAFGVRPKTRPFVGDPAASILGVAEAEDALIALGSWGSAGFRDRVLRAASGPVLFVPRPSDRDTRQSGVRAEPSIEVPEGPVVLAATDGSRASARAGEHAVRLAGSLGAGLLAVYVVDEEHAFHNGIHYGAAMSELARDGEEATAQVAALARERGVEARTLVIRGRPARAIVRVADEVGAEYVVVGSHGSSGLERALLGSVSEEVIHRSPRPVVAVRSEDHPEDVQRNGLAGERRFQGPGR